MFLLMLCLDDGKEWLSDAKLFFVFSEPVPTLRSHAGSLEKIIVGS